MRPLPRLNGFDWRTAHPWQRLAYLEVGFGSVLRTTYLPLERSVLRTFHR